MSYRLSSLAEQDLEEIWFYVAEDPVPPRPIDSLTPSSIDSRCSSNSLAWVATGQSSATAFARSSSRATSNYRYDEDLLIARVLHGRRDQAAAWSEPD